MPLIFQVFFHPPFIHSWSLLFASAFHFFFFYVTDLYGESERETIKRDKSFVLTRIFVNSKFFLFKAPFVLSLSPPLARSHFSSPFFFNVEVNIIRPSPTKTTLLMSVEGDKYNLHFLCVFTTHSPSYKLANLNAQKRFLSSISLLSIPAFRLFLASNNNNMTLSS